MLIEPTKEEVRKYMDFAYSLTLDPTRSGYPTYCDGIKTRENFEESAWYNFSEDGRKILLFEKDGSVEGWIQFIFEEEGKHLETGVFNIADHFEQAFAEFEAYCKTNYPGYELFLGFPTDNTVAVNYLASNGWACIERSYNDVLHLKDYHQLEESGEVVPVTRDNFEDFCSLHQLIEGDMYWNSERLYQKLDAWDIWLYYRNGIPAAAIYYKDAEILVTIYGIDFAGNLFEEAVYRALVTRTLNDCKEKGSQHVVFFNDEETQQTALACGFTCVGTYVCYMKKI